MSQSHLESLRQAFVIPLENNIKHVKSLPLGSFKSTSDTDKQIGALIGMEDCLNHFNKIYEAIIAQLPQEGMPNFNSVESSEDSESNRPSEG